MDISKNALLALLAVVCAPVASGVSLDVSPDRVRTPLVVDMERIGTIRPRSVSEIESSNWTIGCETIERGYADFWQYAQYLAPLGIKTIRIQAGWARCEQKPGVFDFEWLDRIIDFAVGKGLNVLLETSYGNPAYPGAGGWDLGAGFPTSKEGLEAWDRWVETLAVRYKGKVRDWAMWNEPDIRNPALPGHELSKSPEEIARFNVRTAKIIRKVIPDSRLAGLSLATLSGEFFESCLKAMGDDVKIFDWFIYHGYTPAPEDAYPNVEKFKEILKKYNPAAKMRQGENGCPSEFSHFFALSGIPWSEYSQAKWNLRRMLGDLGHDVESSLFTICDFNHKGREMNRKGILRATSGKKVIGIKRAYYAAQNLTSLFDSSLVRVTDPAVTNVDKSVTFYEYKGKGGEPLYVFWASGETLQTRMPNGKRIDEVKYRRPGDSFETRPTVFVAKGSPLKNPVWVDLLTGRIYGYPESRVCVADGETYYLDVPVYDSPCVLTERNVVAEVGCRSGVADGVCDGRRSCGPEIRKDEKRLSEVVHSPFSSRTETFHEYFAALLSFFPAYAIPTETSDFTSPESHTTLAPLLPASDTTMRYATCLAPARDVSIFQKNTGALTFPGHSRRFTSRPVMATREEKPLAADSTQPHRAIAAQKAKKHHFFFQIINYTTFFNASVHPG